MYFSVLNSILFLLLPLIFYGMVIVLTSSLVGIFFNKVIRLNHKVDVVTLLRSAWIGLRISLTVAFAVIGLKALLWKEVNLFHSSVLYADLYSLLFLFLPLTAIPLSVLISAFKQIYFKQF